MGILSLCADSGRPPGPTTLTLSSHDHTPPLSSLHVISDSTYLFPTLTALSPPPTHTPPSIHIRLYAIAALWLHTTLRSTALLCHLTLLGLTISWIALTIFLFTSTLYLSLCFTAEELDTLFPEDSAPNLMQTARPQQQHDPATDDSVHASSPLHITPGTNLHDLNTLLKHRARRILQAQKLKQQPLPINCNWFARKRPQLPTHGHHSKGSPLSTAYTPSWPRPHNISWLLLIQRQFPLPSAPTFSAQAWTTWSNPLSRPWKITLSWLTWLKMQRVSLPWTCATFWSLLTNSQIFLLQTTFFPRSHGQNSTATGHRQPKTNSANNIH
jgi:hypothetical protein